MSLTEQVNAVMAELTEEIKDNKLNLLTPPDLLLQVRAFATNQDGTIEDFANLVQHDPNISGRLIKVANSALLGARVHVTTVKAAISRLGSAKVQSLVTSLVIAQNFIKSKTRGLEDYFDHIWQQSNDVAAISYVLAIKKSNVDPEQALLSGMVHNIGVLPIILRLNQIPALKNDPKLLIQVADLVIPKLYPIAGKLILDSWNFSQEISQIALTHGQSEQNPDSDTTLHDIIFIASELNNIPDVTDINTIPESLVTSTSFNKTWTSWEEAVENLNELSDEINEIKDGITD